MKFFIGCLIVSTYILTMVQMGELSKMQVQIQKLQQTLEQSK